MRVGLYDVDSKLPNLALMKLAAHWRERGAEVEPYCHVAQESYDRIYASKVFTESLGGYLDSSRMEIGGTGWSLTKTLPPEIECQPPDYTLYGYPHSIGFTMRGCRLTCPFCVVPTKEGTPTAVATISEIWTQRDSDFIVLLDNDFFGNPKWRERLVEIHEYSLRVNFSQGLNIRLITEEQALALAAIRFRNLSGKKSQVHFAWDIPKQEKLVRAGIERCIAVGIKPYQMAFYVLVGYDSTEEQDLHRIQVLSDYGCDPYVMPYDRDDPYQKRLARWVNHKATFKTVAWEDYRVDMKNEKVQRLRILSHAPLLNADADRGCA